MGQHRIAIIQSAQANSDLASKNGSHFSQSSDMVKCDAGRLADVLVHGQFFVKKNAKVAHKTNWLDRLFACWQRQVHAFRSVSAGFSCKVP